MPSRALLLALGAVVWASSGCGNEVGDLCRAAARHIEACTGQSVGNMLDACDRAVAEQFLAMDCAPAWDSKADTPVDTQQVITGVLGPDPARFADDVLYFGLDGTMSGDSGVKPYARSYLALTDGDLRFQHGSLAPPSSVLTAAEYQAIKQRAPGAALDLAAQVFGSAAVGFKDMASSPDFYDPHADYWVGKCHAWCWSSLDDWLNQHIEVDGPVGQRGLWIGGEWLSRADLGNWMMGLADNVANREAAELNKTTLSAEELLKGAWQYLMRKEGGGVIADIFLDRKHPTREVWNQPVVGASVETTTLTGEVAEQILAQVRTDGVLTGVTVKLCRATVTYVTEPDISLESDPPRTSKRWNIYVVTDPTRRMVKAYMADDQKLKNIAGLPEKTTQEEFERWWKPTHETVAAVLENTENLLLDFIDKHGKRFRFFVGTVLQHGVPGTVRAAFEEDLAALEGPIDPAQASALAARYPGVANAYSPEQWERAFGSRGLDAGTFGWQPAPEYPEFEW